MKKNPSAEMDVTAHPSGYYPSRWPGECGGPRRQKMIGGPGLGIGSTTQLQVTKRRFDDHRWPVMVVQRGPGELYLQGGTVAGQNRNSFGWVEMIDPVTLSPRRSSPRLPSGGHNWCGGVCVHANGDLYLVNGEYCHRLSPQLDVVAEHHLRTRNAHNGLIVLSDGNLIMKDISSDPRRPSVFTVLSPDLDEVQRLELPVNSIGRFAVDPGPPGDDVYVTTSQAILRLTYRNQRLAIDESWQAKYRIDGEDQGFAWDSCIGDGSAWFMDMGETYFVEQILESRPIGTHPLQLPPRGTTLLPERIAFGPPIHVAPQRFFRFSLTDADDHDVVVAFGTRGGGNIAPPLYDPVRHVLVAFDTLNGHLGAWRYRGPGRLDRLWTLNCCTSNQLSLYATTGELIVDDIVAPGRWDMVVLDVETGAEKGRVDTGCVVSGGMWYAPGFERDVYTTTPVARSIARIAAVDP